MSYRTYILSAFIFFMFVAPCFSATTEKERDIQHLMTLLDIASMPEQMADIAITNALVIERKRFPDMPKEVENTISRVIKNQVLKYGPELFQSLTPLYDKYYTHSEIEELIKFFGSPVGRKYSAVIMPMMNDIIPIAQAWGEKFGPRAAKEVGKELKRLGYK